LQPPSDHDCPCVTVVGRSLSHADRTPCLRAPGSRPLRPDPNLQIRRFLYRRPAPFRTVHDLGLVSSGCPGGSGAPEGCSSAWLAADDCMTPWCSSPSPGLFPATRPRPVLSQTPPPNPIAAEPDGRRVLSGGGVADHEVTPKAPLTGSGCREHSYGGFGGGHPHFLLHAPDLLIRRSGHIVQGRPSRLVCWADIPPLSASVGRCLAAWQQCWQQTARAWMMELNRISSAGNGHSDRFKLD
jgi:hypothetical protein